MELSSPSPLLHTLVLIGSLTAACFAGAPIPTPEKVSDPIRGALTLGYQGSEELHTGYADILQPLVSGNHGALFYDGRFSIDDSEQEVQSHGLVFRYRVPDRDIIFGANVYYDSVESTNGHQFHQLGLGLEVLTRWVDFRANYYLPDQKRERVDQRYDVVGALSLESRTELAGFLIRPGGIATPIYRARNIISGSFLQREFTRFESPLEGLNTELGVLLPGLDRLAEVRLFGGYYHYLNPYGSDYDGFTARLEARIRKGLIAEVQYWEDDVLTGGHWTGGIRASLPFNIGNIFAGRNPFEGASEAFGPTSGDFGDRMTDLVIRSHRVKTTTSGYQQTGVRPATSVTVTRRGQELTFTPRFDGGDGGIGGGTLSLGGSILTTVGSTSSGAGSVLSFEETTSSAGNSVSSGSLQMNASVLQLEL
jgi:hypothetical protein